MTLAHEIDHPATGLALWHSYDPAVKADLWSTAMKTEAGAAIIDPIPLAQSARAELFADIDVAAVIVTNANHHRAAAEFSTEFRTPLFVSPKLAGQKEFADATAWQPTDSRLKNLEPITIDGAAEGEIAIYSRQDRGTLIVGDALINFGSRGFDFLPAKYCADTKRMRRSLRGLLDLSFERIFFAHGPPILKSARERLENLFAKS